MLFGASRPWFELEREFAETTRSRTAAIMKQNDEVSSRHRFGSQHDRVALKMTGIVVQITKSHQICFGLVYPGMAHHAKQLLSVADARLQLLRKGLKNPSEKS